MIKDNTKTQKCQENQGFSDEKLKKRIGGKIVWQSLAREVVEKNFPKGQLLTLNDSLYKGVWLYDKDVNYYKQIKNPEKDYFLQRIARDTLLENGISDNDGNVKNLIKAIILEGTTPKAPPEKLNYDLWQRCAIPLKDGFYRLIKGFYPLKMMKGRPPLCLFSALPISYKEIEKVTKEDCISCIKYLAKWLGNDPNAIWLALEIMGYCLTYETFMQSFFFFYGPKGSGKGTFVRLIQELVGRHDSAASDWRAFNRSNFAGQNLVNKKITVVNELLPDRKNRKDIKVFLEKLLQITGEDTLYIDRKRIAPISIQLKCKFIITSNELLDLGDKHGAIDRRIVPLHFPNNFQGKEDRFLGEKLKRLKPAFYYLAFKGLYRLLTNLDWTRPKSSEEISKEVLLKNDHLALYIKENLIEKQGSYVVFKDLYEDYEKWFEEYGINVMKKLSDKKFSRRLKEKIPQAKSGKKTIGGKTKSVITNITKKR